MGYFGVRIGPFTVGGHTRPKPPTEWPTNRHGWAELALAVPVVYLGGAAVMIAGLWGVPIFVILALIYAVNIAAWRRRRGC